MSQQSSESVCSGATACSCGGSVKRTNVRNLPLHHEGLRRSLGNEFEIGGRLHHHFWRSVG
jgi:hypothetical protein